MRKIIGVLLLLIPFSAIGQYTNQQKLAINFKTDSLLQDFMQYGTLTRAGTEELDSSTVRKFKSLFTIDAQVYDDINPRIDANDFNSPYKLQIKSRNDYIDGLTEDFFKGLSIENKRMNISYRDINNGKIKVVLERKISGVSERYNYQFFNHDTLLINMIIQEDGSIKIGSIDNVSTSFNLKVLNDSDMDGLIDSKDECKDEKGERSLKGCPDRDGDRVADKWDACPDFSGSESNDGCPPSTFAYQYVFSLSTGITMNKYEISVPALSAIYDGILDASHSRWNEIKNPGYSSGYSLNGTLSYYFGKKSNNKNKGISLGVTYSNFKSAYELNDLQFHYRATDNFLDYRRIITVPQMTEDISHTVINVPLMLRFKTKFNAKLAGEIGVGPSLLFSFGNSTYEGITDFAGVYKPMNATFGYPETYTGNETNYVQLNSAIIDDNINSDAANLFMMLQAANPNYNFDFADNKNTSGKVKTKTQSAVGLNAAIDLFYHINATTAIKLGVTAVKSSFNKGDNNYYLLKSSKGDDYHSISDVKSKSNYTAIGLNAGILLGFSGRKK